MTPKNDIDKLIEDHIAPLLKMRGFKKDGRTWINDKSDFSFIVNVQADKWNSINRQAQFFVNYGIFVPSTYQKHFKMPIPKSPKEYDCIIRHRLTTPGNKETWKVAKPLIFKRRKHSKVGDDIEKALTTQCLDYFSKVTSLQDVSKLSTDF